MIPDRNRVLLVLTLFFAGCGASRDTSLLPPSASMDQILHIIEQQRKTTNEFEAISIESPALVQSAPFELWLRKPDSLRLELQGPFGMKIATILIGGDHLLIYNGFQNQVLEGTVNTDKLPAIMAFLLKPSLLFDALCGVRSFAGSGLTPDSISITDSGPQIHYTTTGGSVTSTINSRFGRISEIHYFDLAGNLTMSEQYEFQQNEAGQTLPQTIRLVQEKEGTSATIFYGEISTTLTPGSFAFSVPADAEWRMLAFPDSLAKR
jgi:outer membrane lipoprotein-sorting protein